MKKLLKMMFIMLVIGLMFTAAPVSASANSVKSGAYTYYTKMRFKNDETVSVIYRKKKGSSAKKIKQLNGIARLETIYGKNLYIGWLPEGEEAGNLYCMNTSSRKMKQIIVNGNAVYQSGKLQKKGRYFAALRTMGPDPGSGWKQNFYIVDAKTSKAKLIAKDCRTVVRSGKYFYCAKVCKYRSGDIKDVRILRCKANGSGKKYVSSVFRINGEICGLTSKKLTYERNGRTYKYTFR